MRRAAALAAKELADARAALLADLERKNKELDAFSYSVSHDLRAPLRSIDGFSQMLLEEHGESLNSVGRRYLQRVRDGAERMARLIEGLLQLSRHERADLRRERVDLSLLAHQVGEALASLSPDRSVDFVVADGLVAEVDARLFEIVLQNLVGNAWKFTSKTASPRIEFGLVEQGEQTVFYVKDNGDGFDETYAGRVFAPSGSTPRRSSRELESGSRPSGGSWNATAEGCGPTEPVASE